MSSKVAAETRQKRLRKIRLWISVSSAFFAELLYCGLLRELLNVFFSTKLGGVSMCSLVDESMPLSCLFLH